MVGEDRKSKDEEVRKPWKTAIYFQFKLFNSFTVF